MMRYMILLGLFILIGGCDGPYSSDRYDKEKKKGNELSSYDSTVIERACEKFIAKNMRIERPRQFDIEVDTKVFDTWIKDGNVVTEIGYREEFSDGSYSVRLCVYDEKNGTISSPSPYEAGYWRK